MAMQRDELREGMTVYGSDGSKLGKLVEKRSDCFIIEKGLFFKKDYFADYGLIGEVRGDELHLNRSGEALLEQPPMAGRAEGQPEGRMASDVSETRIPLAEEELEAGKRTKKAGEVVIRKDVVTERKDVSVPLRHEEVHVERTAAPSGSEARPAEGAFEKGTTTIPVYEEEAEIRKRPVVREEIRATKSGYTEERRASEDVRKETAEVEGQGDLDKREP